MAAEAVVPTLTIASLAELRAQSGNGGNSGRGVGGLEGAEGRQQALAGRGVGGVRAHRLAHSGHDGGGRGCACSVVGGAVGSSALKGEQRAAESARDPLLAWMRAAGTVGEGTVGRRLSQAGAVAIRAVGAVGAVEVAGTVEVAGAVGAVGAKDGAEGAHNVRVEARAWTAGAKAGTVGAEPAAGALVTAALTLAG